jgi:hypothetical protein
MKLAASRNRRFKLDKSRQLFVRTHNETPSGAVIMVSIVRSIGGYKPPFPIPKTQSAFHQRAQRTAFRRRGARLQFRLSAPHDQWPKRSPNSNRLC